MLGVGKVALDKLNKTLHNSLSPSVIGFYMPVTHCRFFALLSSLFLVASIATLGCNASRSPIVSDTPTRPTPFLESDSMKGNALSALVDFQVKPDTCNKKSMIITFIITNNTKTPFAFCPYVYKCGPEGQELLPDHGVYVDPSNPREYPTPSDIIVLKPKDSFSFQIPRSEMVIFSELAGKAFFYETPDLRTLPSEYRHAQAIKDLLNTRGIKSGRIYVESKLRE